MLGDAVGKRLGRVDESKLTEALGQRSKGRGTGVREAAGQDEDAHRGNGITGLNRPVRRRQMTGALEPLGVGHCVRTATLAAPRVTPSCVLEPNEDSTVRRVKRDRGRAGGEDRERLRRIAIDVERVTVAPGGVRQAPVCEFV